MKWKNSAKLRARLAIILSAAMAGCLLPSCTALHEYSRRVARQACASMDTCLVYDRTGKHEVPCYAAPDRVVYPGDSGWPFEPGICDSVPTDKAQMSESK